MPNSSSIEDVITQALVELDAECEQFGVRLLLIGGFAVRAYSDRKRETTDVDFVTSRIDRNNLIALFQKLEYTVESESRFGMKATRWLGERVLQVDISVEEIHDLSTDSRYRFPPEIFAEAKRSTIVSLSGDFQATVYVAPLADLLIAKLMTARDRDASDAINLILANLPSEQLQAEIVRKARQAGLANRINHRLAELVGLSDGEIQALMEHYVAGRLTVKEMSNLRKALRSLRI